MYWKILLISDGPIKAEFRTCEIADTFDAAVLQARNGLGVAFQKGGATGQVLSALEMTDPMEAERIFIDSGSFTAYLREMA